DNAVFAIPAARIGLGYGDVEPLMQTVGPGWAAEILFTGRRLSAVEAVAAGLVNRVVAAGDLEASADGLARTIADNAPLSVATAKAALRQYRRCSTERDEGLGSALVA